MDAMVCPIDGFITITALPEARSDGSHLLGTILNEKYKFESHLGEGGMSLVYQGTHVSSGTPVAIKVLRSKLSNAKANIRRFDREVRTLRRFDHHNILTFYDYGRTEFGEVAMVTELLEGCSLKDLIKSQPWVEWPRMVRVAIQVLDALAHAHGKGVVHRDIKPGNIFLQGGPDRTDKVKLLDFGLHLKPTADEARLTMQGRIAGTPFYVAPEQVLRGDITTAADLYALGVVLFRGCTGLLPFDEGSITKTLMAHVRKPVREVFWDHHGVPPEVARLILACLEKRPEDRPQSASELRNQLAVILQQARRTHADRIPRKATGTYAR